MIKYFSSLLIAGTIMLAPVPAAMAQQASSSPYRTRFAVDAPITLGLGAVGGLGLYLVQQKNGLSDAGLAALSKNDVPKFDRFVAGNYSDRAQTVGDFLTYGSLVVAPGMLALNENARGHYGQILGLYLQTMATTAAAFTMTVGTVTRYRPFLYGTEGGGDRNSKISTNSFFAGHTAHTATAAFFAAKVFHDFNPDSPAEPFVWGAAALVSAAVAYSRMEAGKHFLSDNIVGYAVGATAGIVVPQLHKTAGRRGLSFIPIQGLNVNGYSYGGLLITKQL
ncbi:phosphoesterase PA-phosphatase related [Hymenobacter roseosalivarius DSM 11622]|uniref:Phosphoesterase PA-phosphatase related n=1 Tax=Hymenobacter roseosalivarius DSM 11622 TaxID=645990 RepID=A0A1W1V418_9BACT|nr:phosphatase PAP2 family protein [Hymenobacter roseosalivarius]SMB88068.1 phosphoesterase PA-phosphatase related [Hymenobacter roseosalivarius DSM 11622]